MSKKTQLLEHMVKLAQDKERIEQALIYYWKMYSSMKDDIFPVTIKNQRSPRNKIVVPWRHQIQQAVKVMRSRNKPMHYCHIFNAMKANGFNPKAKRPLNSLSALLYTRPDIFRKINTGTFVLAK